MNKLLKGRVSFTVFRPAGQVDSITDVRDRIERYAFHPLDNTDVRDESLGWVDPLLSFDTEHFPNISIGENLILSMRVDSFSLGSAVMRPHLEEALHDFMRENNIEYIPQQQKKEIADQVKQKLKKQSLPKTKIVEAAWNHATGNVYFCSCSKGDVKKFTDLFEKTFEMTIAPFSIDAAADERDTDGETILSELWGGS